MGRERKRQREREKEREREREEEERIHCVDLIISIKDVLKLANIISSSLYGIFLPVGLSATLDAIERTFFFS